MITLEKLSAGLAFLKLDDASRTTGQRKFNEEVLDTATDQEVTAFSLISAIIPSDLYIHLETTFLDFSEQARTQVDVQEQIWGLAVTASLMNELVESERLRIPYNLREHNPSPSSLALITLTSLHLLSRSAAASAR